MKTRVEDSFSEFYERWMCQLEHHLQNLQKVSKLETHDDQTETDPLRALVSTITAHYKNYYTVKWAAAHDDVLAFFCPVWLSPLENAYLWITDWKPSMVFQLIESLRIRRAGGGGVQDSNNLNDLSGEQVRKIEELRVKIRMEEEKVEREMERQQMGMADRKMVELARLATKIRNGETTYEMEGLVEGALKRLMSGLERVMKAGDCVRLKTLKVVLEILGPSQSVRFLAAMALLQIQIRHWGNKRTTATTTTTTTVQNDNTDKTSS